MKKKRTAVSRLGLEKQWAVWYNKTSSNYGSKVNKDIKTMFL